MTERQQYDVVRRIGRAEVRRYHACVLADVTVHAAYRYAANLGFRPLVTYISRNSIAMTAPVIQEQQDPDSWIVSFVMPAGMRLSDLPLPADAQLSLRNAPAQDAVALQFSGIATEAKMHQQERELRAIMQHEHLRPAGPMRLARFDPPWTPGFMRTNEVVIPIEQAPSAGA